MKNSIFEIQAEFCKVMGNPARLRIIHALRARPMYVGELVQETGLPQSLVSRHLGTMRNAGVVQYQRRGSEFHYQLMDADIAKVCDLVRKVLSAQMHRQTDALSASDST